MIKRAEVLGVCIDNYTVREAALQLDTFLSSTVLNVIETITVEKILMAKENFKIWECISRADMTVIGETDIFTGKDALSPQRIREIDNNEFLYEMIRRVVRNHKKVFLLAMSKKEVDKMQSFFEGENPKFKITGTYSVEECGTDLDAIVNEINSATPDMVISSMNSPYEEEFILEHKDKLNLSIWYGIGSDYNRQSEGFRAGRKIKSLVLRGRLYHAVQKYQKESQEKKK